MVNGAEHTMEIEPRVSLLSALRDSCRLTGAKRGCDQGTCGACTVWVDDRRVLACLTLAIGCEGRAVTTVEGLQELTDGTRDSDRSGDRTRDRSGDELHPMQREFIAHDAFQCGYCTPGQLMSAVALVREGHASDDAEIREWMSGNLCRCAAYPNITAAIRAARDQV
nr:(2Fe-2S)-binding protein [Streptomyces sp. SBT349]